MTIQPAIPPGMGSIRSERTSSQALKIWFPAKLPHAPRSSIRIESCSGVLVLELCLGLVDQAELMEYSNSSTCIGREWKSFVA